MPEPTDAIMPILQRIQADVADVKRDLGDTKRELGDKIDGLTKRIDAFEDYLIYGMGLTQRNTADIKRIQSEFAALNSRLPENPR